MSAPPPWPQYSSNYTGTPNAIDNYEEIYYQDPRNARQYEQPLQYNFASGSGAQVYPYDAQHNSLSHTTMNEYDYPVTNPGEHAPHNIAVYSPRLPGWNQSQISDFCSIANNPYLESSIYSSPSTEPDSSFPSTPVSAIISLPDMGSASGGPSSESFTANLSTNPGHRGRTTDNWLRSVERRPAISHPSHPFGPRHSGSREPRVHPQSQSRQSNGFDIPMTPLRLSPGSTSLTPEMSHSLPPDVPLTRSPSTKRKRRATSEQQPEIRIKPWTPRDEDAPPRQRACNFCKSKKLKCARDRDSPRCRTCLSKGLECATAPSQKKK
ncbi:hypothetical protein C8J56DRAFT_964657 [Mycena floridula]|nr:hypothetical protein C8J56DRAFT_964657 [Mycena floridula]